MIAVVTTLLALPLWSSAWNVFDGGIAAASAVAWDPDGPCPITGGA